MKRLLSLLLLLLLTACQTAPAPAGTGLPSKPAETSGETDPLPPGSGEGSRPLSMAAEKTAVTVPETPETASFFLTRWDGEQGLRAFCYSSEDIAALTEALPEVRGWVLTEKRGVEKDPWPIYTLEIGGVEEDFIAAYGGGIWRDNQGNVLRADLDFDGIWARFKEAAEPLKQGCPVNRELALSGGNWDARFLEEAAVQDPDPLVSMELTSSRDGLHWTIANQSAHSIAFGDKNAAFPQVQIAGKWYNVPMCSGKHYVNTLVAYELPSGSATTDSRLYWAEPYEPLPDGTYRLALSFSWRTESENPNEACWNDCVSAAPFSVKNGKLFPAEE